jgi:hypothetical protein
MSTILTISKANSGIFEHLKIFITEKRKHSENDNISHVAFEEMTALTT